MGILSRFREARARRARTFTHRQTGISIELDLSQLESAPPAESEPVLDLSPDEAAKLFFERMKEFSPPAPEADRPLVDEAVDTVEGVSHNFDEETSVDEIFAHHIRMRFFRPRDTTLRGRMLTITILGQLRDGSIAWIGDDSSAYGNCDTADLEIESPQIGDEIRANIVSHAWGHTIAAVDPRTHVTAEEVQNRLTRQIHGTPMSAAPAPEMVLGTWRALLKPGDVVLTHVSFDGTYGFRGGKLYKNRPAAFVGWGSDYAIVRPIYGQDTMVARNDVAEPLLERGCLIKDSAIRRSAYDVHPDYLLKKLGRLGDRDIVRFGFGGRPDSSNGTVRPPTTRQNFKIASTTPVLFATSTEPWKIRFREAALDLDRYASVQSVDDILNLYLLETCTHTDVWDVLVDEGVAYATLAQALKMICEARGLNPKSEPFVQRMERAIATFNAQNDKQLESHFFSEPAVLVLRAAL